MTARIVYLDIERQSGVVDGIWELKQNTFLNPGQVVERPRMICFAWRWEGEDQTHFAAEWDRGGHKAMVKKAHTVLDAADYLVGWNSKRFDWPHIMTEIVVNKMPPPSPLKHIDLMLECRKSFKFLSNRMAYVADQLDEGAKLETGSGNLWKLLRTAKGQDLYAARKKMEAYNIQDVELTRSLYLSLRPYLTGINLPAYGHGDGFGPFCPNCNSPDIQYRGLSRTLTSTYRRFQCNVCGRWGRESAAVSRVTSVPLSQ